MAIRKKDPFDDEEGGSDSTEREPSAPEPKAEREEIEEPSTEVAIDDPEEEEDDVPQTRQERRKNRYKEANQRAEAAERARDEALHIARTAQEQAQQAAFARQPPQQAEDPFKADEDAVYREQDLLYREWSQLSDEQRAESKIADEYADKARALERRKFTVAAKREMHANNIRPSNPNEHIQARIRMDYPDVANHPQAMQYAEYYCRMRMAEGRPMDWNLLGEGMTRARSQFGMSGPPAPTKESKQRYMGAKKGASGGQGEKQTIKMNKHYMGMATAMYPDIEPAKAYQKWANSVGRKLLAKT